ncbi:MAG: hypothetical protein AAGF11_12190 [Myxococcota bacterium]
MAGPEPLQGVRRHAYVTMARKLDRVLELLDDSTVAEVIANYVFRVAVHGVEVATREHQVLSAIARGIAGGLFHAGGHLRGSGKERGDHG